jgi:subtilase family serine protease
MHVRFVIPSLILSLGLGTASFPAPVAAANSNPTSAPTAAAPTARAICGPAAPGFASCLSLLRTDLVPLAQSLVTPLRAPSGYAPADLQSAYALTGPASALGAGMTVAIVDAYDLPTAESDLATYRSQYGLPPCTTANGCFRKVNQTGLTSPYPTPDPTGWGVEIALDIEMVSAICPKCSILLVEATSNALSDLGASVNEAVKLGAVAVSNSYGGGEWSNESSVDAAYYAHAGVAVTASSGDSGFGVEFPAASPHVVSVGGTTLARASNARGWTESAWSGAGSGCSAYESKPMWQTDSGCAKRTVADVSAVADPATGVAVFESPSTGNGTWLVVGGTSASSPIIASVYALAGTPTAGTYPASYPYASATLLNDVTSGSNGSCGGLYLCTAGVGYDGPTGLGTPNGPGAFTTAAPTVTSVTPAGGPTAGGTSVTVTGAGFTGATGVWFGATAATSLAMLSDTQVSAVSPPGSGTVDVTVTGPGGTSATSSTDQFTYVTAPTGATYVPLTPARILDTRFGIGLSGPFSWLVPRTFAVAGQGGVPTGAIAVTGNLTVTNQTNAGYVTLTPSPSTPSTSTLNFPVGDNRANGVTVALSGTGTLSAVYGGPATSSATLDLIFDVTGYFMP